MRTDTLDETAIFVCNSFVKFTTNLKEGKSAYFKQPVNLEEIDTNTIETDTCTETTNINEPPVLSYSHVVKRVKKENLTPDNIGEIFLCQMPGISTLTASAIMDAFGTFSNLISELEINPDCVSNLRIPAANGKTRKMGKNISEMLVRFLSKK
jgi:hypothetical protein